MIPPIASRFIAGKTNESVNEISQELYNNHNIVPIVNRLGEHYTDEDKISESTSEYINLIDLFSENDAKQEISIKPTQIGLDYSTEIFNDNLEKILRKAVGNDIFVWIDMEDDKTVDDTIDAYKSMVHNYPKSVGLCLQSNLKRTQTDLEEISSYDGASVRIVKGAYSTPNVPSYERDEEVSKNMVSLIDYALDNIGHRVAIGSHDEKIIENYTNSSYNDKLEFQMLKGVREEYQVELAEKYTVNQYIPYGEEWISYTYRRIKERPKNITLVFRSLLPNR